MDTACQPGEPGAAGPNRSRTAPPDQGGRACLWAVPVRASLDFLPVASGWRVSVVDPAPYGAAVCLEHFACSLSTSTRRRILPEADLGITSTISVWRILLWGATLAAT